MHTILQEDCEIQRPSLENFIVEKESRGEMPAFYIETYCLEMHAFPNQLEKYEEERQKGIRLEGQNLGI